MFPIVIFYRSLQITSTIELILYKDTKTERCKTSIKSSFLCLTLLFIITTPTSFIKPTQLPPFARLKEILKLQEIKGPGPCHTAQLKSECPSIKLPGTPLLQHPALPFSRIQLLHYQGKNAGSGDRTNSRVCWETLSPALLLLKPQLLHLARPKMHCDRHSGLSSALWGPRWRSSVTQSLHSKFLLSTLDLIAAINTNYASLSVKLRRTQLGGSSSILG